MIESLLKTGFEHIDIFRGIGKYIYVLKERISELLKDALDEESYDEFRIGKIEGSYGVTSFDIANEETGILIYTINIDYPSTEYIDTLEVELTLWNSFDLADMKETKNKLFSQEIEELDKKAKDAGFKYIEFEDDEDFVPHYFKTYPIRFLRTENKKFSIVEKMWLNLHWIVSGENQYNNN